MKHSLFFDANVLRQVVSKSENIATHTQAHTQAQTQCIYGYKATN